VITRAPEQAQDLTSVLEQLGAQVILLPLVQFLVPRDFTELDAAIRTLDEFDWLILTSANAVRFFFGRCRELDRWPSGPRPLIAAVGPATESALKAEGLRASFVPQEFNGFALAAKVLSNAAGKRILIPRSDRGTEELPAALRGAGAMVTEAVAYRTAEPEGIDSGVVDAIRRGEADAITFFSPSAFHALERAIGAAGMAQINSQIAFAAVGPVTAAAIRKAGLAVAVQAPEATSRSLVAALERHFGADSPRRRRTG